MQEEIKAKVREAGPAGASIELETAVNEELIGGFVLEMGDQRYDASVQHKIDLLRKEIESKVTL